MSDRVVDEGDRVFDWHYQAANFVLVTVMSYRCPSWHFQRLSLVGLFGFMDVDIVAVEESQQFGDSSADSVCVLLHQS